MFTLADVVTNEIPAPVSDKIEIKLDIYFLLIPHRTRTQQNDYHHSSPKTGNVEWVCIGTVTFIRHQFTNIQN